MTKSTRQPASQSPVAEDGAPAGPGPLRRWWPVAAVVLLLVGAGIAAANSSLGASRIPPAAEGIPLVPEYPSEFPTAPPSIPVEPRDAGQANLPDLPSWIVTAAIVLAGLAVVAALGYLLWAPIRNVLRRRHRPLPQRPGRTAEGTAREVVAAVDAGLVELDDEDVDPRVAVIACWVRLEEAAAAAGVPRLAGDTSTDLVLRLLRGDPSAGVPAIVSADVLAEFAHVYREARYATRPVDERTRDQARAALRRLRGELTAVTSDEVPA
ncbi:DUF4129 domain-containing protein [Micromonospora globbae]|uniref:DUF4129 domain-containing protein n=1 Tax=Micromonospora globbae TaxID=1894969 RepID=UPI0038647A88|nr:DUF4129 domain-containing protein [Micromonospora globbae]